MKPERPKLDFYALGKLEQLPDIKSTCAFNKGIMDKGNTLMERNSLSLNSANLEQVRNNYRGLKTLQNSQIETNNYLSPLQTYTSSEKSNIRSDMINRETFNIARARYFVKDRESTLQNGFNITKEEFVKAKQELFGVENISKSLNYIPTAPNDNSSEGFKDNVLVFDKNSKGDMIRYPKGYWGKNPE